MKHPLKLTTLLSTAFLLAACGGGGGDDSVVSNSSFAVQTALQRALSDGVTLSGTAVDGSDTWTLMLNIAPAADEVFEGATSKKAVQSVTFKRNGTTAASTSVQNFFAINPYTPKGLIFTDGKYGLQTIAAGVVSDAARVGASGSLGKMTIYGDATKASVVQTQDATWTLEADTSTTAYACVNTTGKLPNNDVISTAAGCYKIDSSGAILGLRFTLQVSGKTLTFR